MIGILRHKVIDQIRLHERKRADRANLTNDAVRDALFDRRGRWSRMTCAWKDDPSQALEAQEFWDALRACLERLPSALAHAFLLRELDGLSGEEVQRILGITGSNLWIRLHRARLSLRACLERSGFGSPSRAK
jgi:RNA polymerase sigma-70 factor (ECF subfamily)